MNKKLVGGLLALAVAGSGVWFAVQSRPAAEAPQTEQLSQPTREVSVTVPYEELTEAQLEILQECYDTVLERAKTDGKDPADYQFAYNDVTADEQGIVLNVWTERDPAVPANHAELYKTWKDRHCDGWAGVFAVALFPDTYADQVNGLVGLDDASIIKSLTENLSFFLKVSPDSEKGARLSRVTVPEDDAEILEAYKAWRTETHGDALPESRPAEEQKPASKPEPKPETKPEPKPEDTRSPEEILGYGVVVNGANDPSLIDGTKVSVPSREALREAIASGAISIG